LSTLDFDLRFFVFVGIEATATAASFSLIRLKANNPI